MEGDRRQAQEAKNNFSEVINRAQKKGHQIITRHGKPAAVVLSMEEFDKLAKPKESLADFLFKSPLRGSGLVIERDKDGGMREVDFGDWE